MAGLDAYTVFCSHFDGANAATVATDVSTGGVNSPHAITFVGTAQLTTAQKMFGTASLLLDGDSDYVSLADSADWAFGSGDWSIDWWQRCSAAAAAGGVYVQRVDNQNYFRVIWSGSDLYTYCYLGGVATFRYYNDSVTVTQNSWEHYELTRLGSTMFFFQNGIDVGITAIDAVGTKAMPDLAASVFFGYHPDGGAYFTGCLEEPRVSKGVARHTAGFSVATGEYTADSATFYTRMMMGAGV